jgi:hypothetical protein
VGVHRERAVTRLALVLAIAFAALAPRRAEAKNCYAGESVVGYTKCKRFGYFWSKRPAMWWEAGATQLRIDRLTGPDDHRAVVATAGSFHQYVGFLSTFYAGASCRRSTPGW